MEGAETPSTNQMIDDDHDYYQDIARSSYADMLKDDERNRAYDKAIRLAVSALITNEDSNPNGDRFFHCCDIGTGSGLLSMMIVRAFHCHNYHDFHITAFEAFAPMAECAKKVIRTNGMLEYITIIPKNSMENEKDPKFDLLVAELLDTELIGEGCLEVYRHAIENLCTPGCLFIPHEARIYVEPVASRLLFERHAISDLNYTLNKSTSVTVKVPQDVTNCCGLADLDDMQVGSLREGIDFVRISRPQVAFVFTFNKLDTLNLGDHCELTFELVGKLDQPLVVVMWWDIEMYDGSRLGHISSPLQTDLTDVNHLDLHYLSCAPLWARDERMRTSDAIIRCLYDRDVWREHWIQAIYYFADVKQVREMVGTMKKGDRLTVHAYHDAYSLWFELAESSDRLPRNCTCGVHRNLSGSQLAFLSDQSIIPKLLEASLSMALPGSPRQNHTGELIFKSGNMIDEEEDDDDAVGRNSYWIIKINESVTLEDPLLNGQISWAKLLNRMLMGESTGPITDIHIMFTQVQLDNLHRIRSRVGTCEEFIMTDLDDMVELASTMVDQKLESHHLWEYGSTRMDEDYSVLAASHDEIAPFVDSIRSGEYKRSYKLPLVGDDCKSGWALVFWCEFRLAGNRQWFSTGPIDSENPGQVDRTTRGQRLTWARNYRQQVYFMHDLIDLTKRMKELEIDLYLECEKIRPQFVIPPKRPKTSSHATRHRDA